MKSWSKKKRIKFILGVLLMLSVLPIALWETFLWDYLNSTTFFNNELRKAIMLLFMALTTVVIFAVGLAMVLNAVIDKDEKVTFKA